MDKDYKIQSNDESELSVDWPKSIGELKPVQIMKDGIKISINDWVYIPHNINYPEKSKKLEEQLKQSKLDIDKIKKDIPYITQNRDKIKKVYNNLEGGINFNSMLLYSGPSSNKSNFMIENQCCDYYCLFRYVKLCIEQSKPACIYTGDADLNNINIKEIFDEYWNYVGTIQLPHHGDKESFDRSLLEESHFIFPVSYGKTNTYGHPVDNVIIEIISHGSFVAHVNEDKDSIYIQLIKKKDTVK